MANNNLNIFQKMEAISAALQTVGKNLEIRAGKTTYKAVSEADVLRAVKPLEHEMGVYSYPYSREIIESGTIESAGFDGSTKKQFFLRIKTVFRFVNIDKPDDFIDVTTYGDGIDSGDKSVGKAMTYGDKYALLKAYKIVTGEDPDQEGDDLNGADITPDPLTKEALDEAAALNMNIADVATYFRKTVEALTNEELRAAIEAKKNMLAKRAAQKAQAEAEAQAPKQAEEVPENA